MEKPIGNRNLQEEMLEKSLDTENKTTRLPILFCIECTEDMPIYAIQSSINEFLYSRIYNDDELKTKVETSILIYAEDAEIIKNISGQRISSKDYLKLKRMKGEPNLINAINTALKEFEVRKKLYRIGGINYYKPIIMVISSGKTEEEREKIEETAKKYKNKEVSIIPFIQGLDNPCSRLLKEISSDGRIYQFKTERYDSTLDIAEESLRMISRSSANAYKSLTEASKKWEEIRRDI